jgi:GNAT superfamily N-acetyltransferase
MTSSPLTKAPDGGWDAPTIFPATLPCQTSPVTMAYACLEAYFRELAARFDAGFDPGGSPPPPNEYAPPNGAFVMARLEGKPVGIGALKRLDAEIGEIKRVWTSPDVRGLGIARRILHALEGAARERGLALLRLDTNRTLIEAQAFYAREGYREIPRYNDNPYANHLFEKRLVGAGSNGA